MSVPSVSVMLNRKPYYYAVAIDPVSATVHGLIASVRSLVAEENMESTVRLRWIVDENSAYPCSLIRDANAAAAWYANKGRHLKSDPIENDEDLRKKLRYIEESKSNVVQLYAIGRPPELLGVNKLEDAKHTYMKDLNGGRSLNDPFRTTASNPTPSMAATDRKVHQHAQLKAPMYDGRHPLADNLGPNVGIYFQPFAEMWSTFHDKQKLSQVKVDSDMEDIVEDLCLDLAANTVKIEDDYMEVIGKQFPRLLPRGCTFKKKYRLQRPGAREAELDFAVTCVTPYGEEITLLVGEAKFEDGNGGCGPSQALYGYRRVFILPQNRCFFFSTCCPCLIVAMTGHLLHLDAAIFTDAVYCTGMTVQSLSLKRGATNAVKMRLVRCFQVLRNTMRKLARFYEETHIGSRDNGPFHLLPAPCVAPKAGGPCVPFKGPNFSLKFKDMVFSNQGRAIFKGEITVTKSDLAAPSRPLHDVPSTSSAPPPIRVSSSTPSVQSVYVKFVDRYGVKVHKHLAKLGFAPKLWWFGEVVGGAFMVVMDEVKGRTVQDYLDNKDTLLEKDLIGLDVALGHLRSGHFVHGDLRPPNVVMRVNDDGTTTAVLIDFDWAGKAGEARYPRGRLNRKVKWPLPVDKMPGALILYEHDDSMRKNMLSQPTGKLSGSAFTMEHPSKSKSKQRRRQKVEGGGDVGVMEDVIEEEEAGKEEGEAVEEAAEDGEAVEEAAEDGEAVEEAAEDGDGDGEEEEE